MSFTQISRLITNHSAISPGYSSGNNSRNTKQFSSVHVHMTITMTMAMTMTITNMPYHCNEHLHMNNHGQVKVISIHVQCACTMSSNTVAYVHIANNIITS